MPRASTAPDSAAPERTRLAWRRTTLAATAAALLLLRLAVHRGGPAALAITALAGLCWVLLLIVIQQRIRALSTPGRPARRVLMLTTAACIGLGALGVVLVLW